MIIMTIDERKPLLCWSWIAVLVLPRKISHRMVTDFSDIYDCPKECLTFFYSSEIYG